MKIEWAAKSLEEADFDALVESVEEVQTGEPYYDPPRSVVAGS